MHFLFGLETAKSIINSDRHTVPLLPPTAYSRRDTFCYFLHNQLGLARQQRAAIALTFDPTSASTSASHTPTHTMASSTTKILKAFDAAKPLLPPKIHCQKMGVVVSAGLMTGAVKVRVAEQKWNKHFRKLFPAPRTYLVRDPNKSLVPGDVVRISSGNRTSKAIHHVVTAIVAPFGEPVENRPPVKTQEELDEERIRLRLLKDVRSAEKGRLVSQLRLKQAAKQGRTIPTLEQAMEGLRLYEEDLRARGVGAGKKEKHKGQAGQQMTRKLRRMEEGRKIKEEKKAEEKAKKAKVQAEAAS